MESNNYSHTSTGSKRAIFTFFATFIACLLMLDNTASLFTGAVFVFAGMFATSVIVAMPFYLYKKNHPTLYPLVSIIEFLLTIFLTVIFFLYFFTYPHEANNPTSSSRIDTSYIVKCDQPVQEFTLGMDIIPSKVKTNALCSCIWKGLSASDKNLSASLARNNHHDASEVQLKLFTSRFNVITEYCRQK